MTVHTAPAPTAPGQRTLDHRGSWIPTGPMIATRFLELRRRRGLMLTLTGVMIGIPVVVLAIRLISHAVDPKAYGPAGGYGTFTGLVAGFMYIFGFIVAATVGCTAGSVDLTEGMFRHLVITGRSRLALYLARIPAGLGIVLPIVAIGFSIVCAVCVFAAPTTLDYNGVTMPAGLTQAGFTSWAADHPTATICNFPFNGPPPGLPPTIADPCAGPGGPGGPVVKGPGSQGIPATPAQLRYAAVTIAQHAYADYHANFLSPPLTLMLDTGLWILLEATIGFIVGLGLSSLMGQRTVAVILLVVLELILTPLLSRHVITHLLNVQRGIVGAAMAHLEPTGLPQAFGGGGGGGPHLIPESRGVSVAVVVGWLVVWTVLGAWRMATRDA